MAEQYLNLEKLRFKEKLNFEIINNVTETSGLLEVPPLLTQPLIENAIIHGFKGIDYTGEIYSLPKWTGIKTKEVKDRLGTPETLPSIDDVKQEFEKSLTPKLEGLFEDLKQEQALELETFNIEKRKMALDHKHERNHLKAFHDKRQHLPRHLRQVYVV